MKKQLIHVTLIARADDGIWYICTELFAHEMQKVKLISSTVMPLLSVTDQLNRLYSAEVHPETSLN